MSTSLEEKEVKKFDKELDKPTVELKTIQVKVPILNKYSGRVEGYQTGEKVVEETVTYTQAKIVGSFCRAEDHDYYKIEETKGGYVALCSKCNHGRFVNPRFQTIRDGKIVERKSIRK